MILVYYYNFPLPDFEFCSIDVVLDTIKVMSFALSEGGKVAVHCHAGLGRTGAMIACYLVLATGMNADDALFKVRKARPNSVQSAIQVEIVERAEDLMHRNARVLPSIPGETLSTYFIWQNGEFLWNYNIFLIEYFALKMFRVVILHCLLFLVKTYIVN